MSLLKSLRAPLAAALLAITALTATVSPTPALAQAASAPADAAPAAAPAPALAEPVVAKEEVMNPYGLEALWSQGDFVARGTLIIMIIMSMGSWYIIFTKLFEQQKMLKASNAVGESFWKAGSMKQATSTLDEGSDGQQGSGQRRAQGLQQGHGHSREFGLRGGSGSRRAATGHSVFHTYSTTVVAPTGWPASSVPGLNGHLLSASMAVRSSRRCSREGPADFSISALLTLPAASTVKRILVVPVASARSAAAGNSGFSQVATLITGATACRLGAGGAAGAVGPGAGAGAMDTGAGGGASRVTVIDGAGGGLATWISGGGTNDGGGIAIFGGGGRFSGGGGGGGLTSSMILVSIGALITSTILWPNPLTRA